MLPAALHPCSELASATTLGPQARYSTKAQKRRAAAGHGGEDAAFPAGRATVQAGLRSFGLSKAEQQRFAHCAPAYREAR